MTHQLTILLTETELQQLKKAAALDCRTPRDEARFLLRNILFAIEVDRKEENLVVQSKALYENIMANLYRSDGWIISDDLP